ncbi:MAG: A/G-specific adenine glycosylase [Bacillota bacterium]
MARAEAESPLTPPPPAWAAAFQQTLLDWYGRERRDLPWRQTRDPYSIWVSEVMLQQTRVETVVPYYRRFLEQFPTASALAQASPDQVLKAWEGLGYYSRARRLQEAAREVEERYGGRVPGDPEAFGALPGVGSYTAGAVLSIAFGLPVPAVDGNVMRVLSRLLLIRENTGLPAVRRGFEALAAGLVPSGRAGDFNQALMELGALVCLPRRPRCEACPVAALCRAREEGVQEALPVKDRAPAARVVPLVAAALLWQGRLLVRQRPGQGLLAGLWEFPNWPRQPGETDQDALLRGLTALGLPPLPGEPLPPVSHAFSHLRWEVQPFLCRLGGEARYLDGEARSRDGGGDAAPPAPEGRWVTPEGLSDLALPRPMARIAASLAQYRQKRLDGLDAM